VGKEWDIKSRKEKKMAFTLHRGRRATGSRPSEERRHPRVILNLPIEYSSGRTHRPRAGHTFNLSPDGVMVNLPERLDIGQQIGLSIFFSFGQRVEWVRVNSQVIWVDSIQQAGSYRSGIKFIDLSSHDRSKLEKFFEPD
jgi:hypothetical protein